MDLAINNVKNVCNFVGKMCVCVCVCVCVCMCMCMCVCVWVAIYLELLSHFLPFKIHLTNISPISIKMVDFKNLPWATSFATRASRKFIHMPYRASGKKSYCHTLKSLLWQLRQRDRNLSYYYTPVIIICLQYQEKKKCLFNTQSTVII